MPTIALCFSYSNGERIYSTLIFEEWNHLNVVFLSIIESHCNVLLPINFREIFSNNGPLPLDVQIRILWNAAFHEIQFFCCQSFKRFTFHGKTWILLLLLLEKMKYLRFHGKFGFDPQRRDKVSRKICLFESPNLLGGCIGDIFCLNSSRMPGLLKRMIYVMTIARRQIF